MNTDTRINLILHNSKFNEYLNNNNISEQHRKFCKHDLNHLIDVARVAYIISLENNLNYSKDMIYAASLLHDIGRWQQYKQNVPHETASANLAREILQSSNYSPDEIHLICSAILNHRNYGDHYDRNSLDYIIYKSDKLSRKCFSCSSINECNWNDINKNYDITY